MLYFFGLEIIGELGELYATTSNLGLVPRLKVLQAKRHAVFCVIQIKKTFHPFRHTLLMESQFYADVFLKISLLLRFLDSHFSQVFPELYDRVENNGSGESRVGEKKGSFLVIEKLFIVRERKGEI